MSLFNPAKPTVKPALKHGQPLCAFWFAMGSVAAIEIAARAKPDVCVIDMQHGLFDRVSLEAAVLTAPCPVLVRTRDAAPASISEALDAGAEGVIVPLVESAKAATAVAQSCRYPPDGIRSGGGIRPLADFAAHVELANQGVVAGVMIETAAGVKAARAIARSGVDLIFIGTGDLSLSLGTPPGSEAHSAAMATILKAAQEAQVPCGAFAMSGAQAAERIGEGYALTVAAIDQTAIETSMASELAAARAAMKPRRRRPPVRKTKG
ncbi:MAG: aldolase/citrate lyase family protein [Pseudomonadota bacterium]